MTYPINPNTIVIQNNFYQEGLKEIDIWEYYVKNKSSLLKETINRDIMFVISTDVNQFVIKRQGTDTNFLRLSNSNYLKLVNGRTVSIYSTMNKYENFGIIDIDTDDWNKARETTRKIYLSLQNLKNINDLQIRYTGKKSFHIKCQFKTIYHIEDIRKMFYYHLINDRNLEDYTVQKKRNHRTPNIDIYPNVFRGGYITLHSLSIWGLRCKEVDFNRLDNFVPDSSKILTL